MSNSSDAICRSTTESSAAALFLFFFLNEEVGEEGDQCSLMLLFAWKSKRYCARASTDIPACKQMNHYGAVE